MDVCPKFVVINDPEEGYCLIIAKCTYHKQLVYDINTVKGGGWWEYNTSTKTFTLFGESHDFGKAKISDIITCIKNGKIFRDKYLARQLTRDDKFEFKDIFGTISELI